MFNPKYSLDPYVKDDLFFCAVCDLPMEQVSYKSDYIKENHTYYFCEKCLRDRILIHGRPIRWMEDKVVCLYRFKEKLYNSDYQRKMQAQCEAQLYSAKQKLEE